jgi:HlyD family secretion protein
MDVKRDPAILRRKRIRRTVIWSVVGAGVIALSVALSQLQPAAPSVPHATLWFGTVKRGPMVREVRGAGTLVPEEIRWITSKASGNVERVVLKPGAAVKPGTVILELTNPDLRQQVNNAELQLRSAEAQVKIARANLAQTFAQQEAAVKTAESSLNLAKAELEAQQKLQRDGLVPEITINRLKASLGQAQSNFDLAEKQLVTTRNNEASQIAPQEAQVNQARTTYDQLRRQLDDLQVKSTMSGVLQVVGVEVGQQVGQGAQLARVSDPTNLKALIRISETQMRDLAIGQSAKIDTRNGEVKGVVSRIDPAAANGTVGVDVTLEGELPPGARPDLSVDGVVELQRLENVLYVEHPAIGQENSTIGLFKVLPNGAEVIRPGQEAGHEAVQTPVKFGRQSVSHIEVVEGLKEGDVVVLSDMSQHDGHNRIRIVS